MKIIWQYQWERFDFSVYNDRPDFHFYEVKQVHGKDIATTPLPKKELVEADGLLSLGEEPCHLAIKTADCLPVAFLGLKGCANIHAGWRGLHAGILLDPSLKKLEPQKIIIGPAIQRESYEVGEEFREYFSAYPQCLVKNDQKLTFDLPGVCEIQLKRHYHGSEIINCNLDTFSNPELNSYRRNQTTRRNYNVLKVMRKK